MLRKYIFLIKRGFKCGYHEVYWPTTKYLSELLSAAVEWLVMGLSLISSAILLHACVFNLFPSLLKS